mgnify:CR=1 FL=1
MPLSFALFLTLAWQNAGGHLHGRVTDPSGSPLGGATVELRADAFCRLLETLSARFPTAACDARTLAQHIEAWAHETARHGAFNFLLSDGTCLYVHCSTRLCYIERAAPFTVARLVDADVEVDFSRLTTPEDRVAVIATAPLTANEVWTPLAAGEFAVFEQGRRRR